MHHVQIATTRHAFNYDFGPGANYLTVNVPAGAICHWHAANECWYVDPSQVEPFARHDAFYRGIRVPLDCLAIERVITIRTE